MKKIVILFTLFIFLVLFFQVSRSKLENIQILNNNKPNHSLVPVISNQWFSSIYKNFPSQPLYAFPLVYKLHNKGLGFSYPDIVKVPNAVHASYSEDFSIGINDDFTSQRIENVNDWSVKAKLFNEKNQEINFVIGHGIPFTSINSSEDIHVFLNEDFTVYPNNQELPFEGSRFFGKSFRLSTKDNEYIFVFPKENTIEILENQIVSGSNKVFVGLLDKKENYDKFIIVSEIEIQGTDVSFSTDDSHIFTTYSLRSNIDKPLIALYPHQKDLLSEEIPIIGEYSSIRGNLSLVQANSFSTKIPIYKPYSEFPSLKNKSPELEAQIKEDANTILTQEPPSLANSYYYGTHFGKLTTLIQLADMLGLQNEKKSLEQKAKPLFLNSLDNFVYDDKQKSLISKNNEFGNSNLNDHHLQYGYYIRAASILADKDPVFFEKIKPQISAMVNDIANLNRQNENYPFIRNFDLYEGHSWADGYASFTDGNNLESSSEALNAWYSLLLWADLTENLNLKKNSIYLFNTELNSARHYWFDTQNIYGPPYDHKIASIVWGGKADFSTWFSSEANKVYGIQLLPLTPASFYLGTFDNFYNYEADLIRSGGSYSSEWGDLMLVWKSFYKPSEAILEKNRVRTFQADNLRSIFLYYLLYNYENR